MRKFLIALALAMLGALLIPLGTATATPAVGELRSNWIPIPPKGQLPKPACLHVSGNRIEVKVCDNSKDQRFIADGSVTGSIQHWGDGCVDVGGGATNPGALVQIWSCNGTAAQQWQFIPVNTARGLFYSVRNPVSGLCLRWAANVGSIIADCAPVLNPEVSGQVNLFTLAPQLF
jgi:hypothetical protein